MAIQTFVADTILTAAQMNALQSNDYNQTVSTKTASYTLVAADKGTKIVMNAGATSTAITVNTSLFAAGDTLTILNTSTSGTCTVTAGTATVATAGSLALGLNQGGTLYFTSAGVAVFQANGVSSTSGQVVSTAKTDTFTTTSTSYVDVTGFSVSITPTSASSTVLILANFTVGNAVSGVDPYWRLMRGSTAIYIGDAASSRTRASTGGRAYADAGTAANSLMFLDSPATTSATTYKLQAASNTGVAIYINRSSDDTDAATRGRFASSITVMEIKI